MKKKNFITNPKEVDATMDAAIELATDLMMQFHERERIADRREIIRNSIVAGIALSLKLGGDL